MTVSRSAYQGVDPERGENDLPIQQDSPRDDAHLCVLAGRLIERYGRTGEESHFLDASRALSPWLERLIGRIAGRGTIDQEEIAGAVLTRIFLYSSRFRFQGGPAFRCWVVAIVRNAVRQFFRDQASRARPLDRVPEPADERSADPLRLVLLREEAESYARAWTLLLGLCVMQIGRTPRFEKAILDSHHCRGLSFREIAARSGERMDRIAGMVRRARSRFLRGVTRSLGGWQ